MTPDEWDSLRWFQRRALLETRVEAAEAESGTAASGADLTPEATTAGPRRKVDRDGTRALYAVPDPAEIGFKTS